MILLSPFISRIAKLATRIIPDAKPSGVVAFQYISDESLGFPDTSYEALRKESRRLYLYSLEKIPSIFGLEQSYYDDANFPESGRYVIMGPEEVDTLYEKDIKILY